MATKKALVLDDSTGLPTEIGAGDTLSGSPSQVTMFSASNAEAGSIAKPEAVYLFGAGSVKKALADASATAIAVGFVADAAIAASASGNFQSDGVLDGFTGLTPGATYFLSSSTAGAISTAIPTGSGHHVVKVGKALSATQLLVDIDYVCKRA